MCKHRNIFCGCNDCTARLKFIQPWIKLFFIHTTMVCIWMMLSLIRPLKWHLVFRNVFSILSHYGKASGKMGRRYLKTITAGIMTTAWNCCYISPLSFKNPVVGLCCPLQEGMEHDTTWVSWLVCGYPTLHEQVKMWLACLTCPIIYTKEIGLEIIVSFFKHSLRLEIYFL